MKKGFSILVIVFFIILSIILQTNLFNNIYIFGVKINLLLILTVAISLWYGIFVGSIYGLINGFISDSLYEHSYGRGIFIYCFIGILIGSINHIYKRENKVTLIYVIAGITIIYEIIDMIIHIILAANFPGIFTVIRIITLSSILNSIVASIVYYAVVYISYNLDEVLVIENRW